MSGKVKLVVAFGTGAVAGMIAVAGLVELMGREGWHVGGEALILPLMALLIYFGWNLGSLYDEWRRKYERAKSYRRGYREGLRVSCIVNLNNEEQREGMQSPEQLQKVLARRGIGY